MNNTINKAITAAAIAILRPLVRLLLRKGIPYGVFSDLAKRVYVDVAEKEFKLEGRKQTKSRVSVLTGLSRKEVLRVMQLPAAGDPEAEQRYNRITRVLSGWRRDYRFADEHGNPATLPMEGDSGSFAQLVKLHSGDIPARAMLDELQRMDLVSTDEAGDVQLHSPAYLPNSSEADQLHILGTDTSLLIDTINYNLKSTSGEKRFQRKVLYDNLPEEVLPKLQALSREHGQALLEELDQWLAQHDRDSNDSVDGTGRKTAGIGIYYFEHDTEQDDEEIPHD